MFLHQGETEETCSDVVVQQNHPSQLLQNQKHLQ